jgi:FKBP-type peptidyl-prolyl cis-trans isomerase 2
MLKMPASLAPGQWVRLTAAPEWGPGQVQSVAGARVTVNFEHAGKRLIQADVAKLETVDPALEKSR